MSEEKLKITVFVPLSSCTCNYSKYIDRIFLEMIPYKEHIEFEVKDVLSEEGTKLNLLENSIIIYNPPNRENPLIFASFLELRHFFRDYFI
jgi:hypothetical protein